MQLNLRCVEGAVDLLAAELGQFVIRSNRSSVDCCVSDLQEIAGCRLYSSAAIPLPGSPGDETFLEPLQHLEPVAFRVGADSATVRRELVSAVERMGWRNDPRDWAINLTESPAGWVAEVGELHWVRRFGRLERLPWATSPVVAEVLVRLAKIRAGQVVLDPFCGSGTVLVAARAQQVDVRVVGADQSAGSIELARRNLGDGCLRVGFAEELKHADGSVDRVVANLPFGKRVGSHQDNLRLYPAAVGEIARVLTKDGRAVLMTEDKRLLRTAVAGTQGLKIVKERLLRFNGATPTVFVLMPTRR
ncbi:methyltransferase domain-containing protein [Kribbella antibiotica]|uniref:Methyltransferase domain-containing protein n=1 Tax=Kribbella antibiotica TaxID=190195 RepID=A0A4V2YQJ0_9ACTN|nr:methyltransferase domain-containing protein [Kribbella antibiotica]TDD62157.1 methyltransferase domain-containing protein [Kribbella antibiotica]